MKQQVFNPYMPSWEYVPDGEPHVFGDRVYVYGSHDRFNGYSFCLNDYVCWSAPVDDLSDWRYEGVIYKKTDDPMNPDGEMCLYAPDVTQGADGRYYLYYVLDMLSVVAVAVCDTPAGKYEFYGYVHYEDGTLLGEGKNDEAQFDPGVLFENGKVYLYTGFCPAPFLDRSGPMVTVLDGDMLTIKEAPRFIAPSTHLSAGSGYEGHEFFEASSTRKFNGKYYFVYSSTVMHELCYAVSDSPVEGFRYQGVLVSNVDMGIDSYKPAERPMAYGANNHGGLGAPLKGKGEYPAYIACNLYCSIPKIYTGDQATDIGPEFPRITQEGRDGDENPGYIANMRDGAVAGFKYFDCKDVTEIRIKVRGNRGIPQPGKFQVLTGWDGEVLGEIPCKRSNEWHWESAKIRIPDGVHALYFRYAGQHEMSLGAFELV